MKISVIMPSYNCAAYIRRAIDSVLAQPYEDKELIVIDGASTDGTVDILTSYGDRISWVSEKDAGQADAINKGIARATGDIISWLNADDYYEPAILDTVAAAFASPPAATLVYGNCRSVSANASIMNIPPKEVSARLMIDTGNVIFQPASFYRGATLRELGGVDASLHIWMEYDLCIRLLGRGEARYVDTLLANFMLREDQKSDRRHLLAMDRELVMIAKRYGTGHLSRVRLAAWYHRVLAALGLL